LREAKRQIQRPQSTAKVFGIGLTRTGTTSLKQALSQLGYDCLHFNKDSKIIEWLELYAADAAVDTPVSTRFRALYYAFEDARFMYTTRDTEDWVRSVSVQHFFGISEPRALREHWNGEDYWEGNRAVKTEWKQQNAIQDRTIQERLYRRYDSWREAYEQYDRRVKKFFDEKLGDALRDHKHFGGRRMGPAAFVPGGGASRERFSARKRVRQCRPPDTRLQRGLTHPCVPYRSSFRSITMKSTWGTALSRPWRKRGRRARSSS
jgi:hypothetical protein